MARPSKGSGPKFPSVLRSTGEIPHCPTCGASMVERNGRFGAFFGCSQFSRGCRGLVNITEDGPTEATIEKVPRKVIAWSEEQADGINGVKDNLGAHVFFEAKAGVGKTTLGVEMAYELGPDRRFVALAFNKKPSLELAARMPPWVLTSTMHAFGRKFISDINSSVRVDADKTEHIIDGELPIPQFGHQWTPAEKQMFMTHFPMRQAIIKLVSLCKAHMYIDPINEQFDFLVDRFGINTVDREDDIFGYVHKVMLMNKEIGRYIDYEDMILYPAMYPYIISMQPDDLFCDEMQDFNIAQHHFAYHLARKGRVVGVGDRRQTIYGFRGADLDSITNFSELLGNVMWFPINATRRCGRAIVEYAQQIVPDFTYADNVGDGLVRVIDQIDPSMAVPGDTMILSRTNAPLVGQAFNLISSGVKCLIEGKEFGMELRNLVYRMDARTPSELITTAERWRDAQIMRMQDRSGKKTNEKQRKRSSAAAQLIRDQARCIIDLASQAQSTRDVVKAINDMFAKTDKAGDPAKYVLCSTSHRAKGLERKRVIVIEPENYPHELAEQDWERDQEENIKYVTATRPSDELLLVGGSMGGMAL